MDVTEILEPLNDAQREAVTAPAGHLLVLAGAGSGKTRVLVHRIAWLLATREATPFGILAVTFTNKAASEMRTRIESMLGRPVGGMWVGTFHGLAHRLLRAHWRDAGLREDFQILDSDDQLRCIRRVLRDLDLDEQRWPPRQAQGFINARKDEGLRAEHLEEQSDWLMERMRSIYSAYQEMCERTGVVDFAELLLRCHELFRDRDDVLAHYRERFRHVLVDEFQDTNTIQYAWLRLLAGSEGSLCCVGDDDQSVYGWRGARIENIQQFPRDFADVATVRLERNYRSSGNILAAANALIANNRGRMGKNLWTEDGDGEPIDVYSGFNDIDEARFIVSRIRQWVDSGGRRDEVAILYRVSAQSRVLEEALLAQRVAYRVFGGLRFYERAEIKSALAYCRLVANRDDDAAFERIVNLPPRGIGARTVDILRTEAKSRSQSLWAAALRVIDERTAGARACGALRGFVELIDDLASGVHDIALHEQIDAAVERSGLLDYYRQAKIDRAQTRIENLQELVIAAGQFAFDGDDGDPQDPLTAFLSRAALEAGEEQAAEGEDLVSLMTLHSAKGLEFPVVFVCGMEEGLFPHSRSSDDPEKLEEERRLCYVGMTRAKRKLCMSHAESRRLYGGSDRYSTPSRFLRELPPERVEEVRLRGTVSRPGFADSAQAAHGFGADSRRVERTAPRTACPAPEVRRGRRADVRRTRHPRRVPGQLRGGRQQVARRRLREPGNGLSPAPAFTAWPARRLPPRHLAQDFTDGWLSAGRHPRLVEHEPDGVANIVIGQMRKAAFRWHRPFAVGDGLEESRHALAEPGLPPGRIVDLRRAGHAAHVAREASALVNFLARRNIDRAAAAATVWAAEPAVPVSEAVVVSLVATSAGAALAVETVWAGACVCSAGSPIRDWPTGAIRAATMSGLLFIFAYACPPIEFATKYMPNPNTVRRISITPNWRQKTSSALLT